MAIFQQSTFCDRITETTTLTRYITNGNNVALISPRRLGKTGLIEHCFHQQQIREVYHTFLIDIYATKNFQEFVFELGRGILNGLKPRGRKKHGSCFSNVYPLFAPVSLLISVVIPVGIWKWVI